MTRIIPCPEVSAADLRQFMLDPAFVEDVGELSKCGPDAWDAILERFCNADGGIVLDTTVSFDRFKALGNEVAERFEDAAWELAQRRIDRDWQANPYDDEEIDDDI